MNGPYLTVSGVLGSQECGYFVSVTSILDGREHGTDVYEDGTIQEWESAGLIAYDIANTDQIVEAARKSTGWTLAKFRVESF